MPHFLIDSKIYGLVHIVMSIHQNFSTYFQTFYVTFLFLSKLDIDVEHHFLFNVSLTNWMYMYSFYSST